MGYVVMTTSPWGRGWHEIKWDFEYTGESMGEVGKLASDLYGKVSRLEERADILARETDRLRANQTLLERELKNSREQVERQVKTILDQNDALEKRERTIERLKDTIESLRATPPFEAVERFRQSLASERKIVENQKGEIIRLLNELDEKDKDVGAFITEMEKLEARYDKLREGMKGVLERVSRNMRMSGTENGWAYAYGNVHRWLSQALEDADPPVKLVDGEGIACGNCVEAATPDA
jgi:chromosome segregation ATPase